MDPADTRQVHDADVLTLLSRQDRLNFAPGTQYHYSNSGYALLALIVGRASGLDFAAFLQQRIFRPQAWPHCGPSGRHGYHRRTRLWLQLDRWPLAAHRPERHQCRARRWRDLPSLDDLARWDAALYDDRLLSKASRRAMFSPATSTSEPDVPHYGFGWRLNGPVQWHSGESIGFRNVVVRHPEKHLTVIVLTNRNAPEPYPLALKIAQRWLDTLQ